LKFSAGALGRKQGHHGSQQSTAGDRGHNFPAILHELFATFSVPDYTAYLSLAVELRATGGSRVNEEFYR
jgi:hypothetical protein